MPQNQKSGQDRPYGQKTADDYIRQMRPEILAQLNPDQLNEVHRLLQAAIPQPSPKIVDLRFVVDLLIDRFYVVLFVGKDRRRQPRRHILPNAITRIGNWIAVIILLISFNLTISATLLLGLYLLKSAVGIDLLPGHFPDTLRQLLQ